MAQSVDVKKLLESGAHFGHKSSRWHPKMAPYIHSKRGDSHIIDLVKTAEMLEPALDFIVKTVSEGKQALLVGTKRQASEIVRKAADDTNMPFVTERWLGGMLTNYKTMSARIKRLKMLEEQVASGELATKYSKLEVQRFQEEIERLNLIFGGLKDLQGMPGVVYVTDVVTDSLAVKEAQRLGIPVVALVDTNADPTGIDYIIPANDDAIKAIDLITSYVVEAIEAGKAKRKAPKAAEPAKKPAAAKAEAPAKAAEEAK